MVWVLALTWTGDFADLAEPLEMTDRRTVPVP